MILRRILALFIAAVALAGVSSAHAQEGALHAQIVAVSDTVYPHAEAIVNIEDTSGAQPHELQTRDFSVLIGGAPVPVTSADLASRQGSMLDVLLVIDTSGSMQGAPLARAKEAAHLFVAGLAPEDRVAIIHFGDEVRELVDYTTDRTAIGAAIDGLRALGNTALYQATGASAVKVGQSTAHRRVVILLSDGADFGGKSTIKREDALSLAAGIGATYFTVAEGTDIDRTYLSQLAEVTKGRYLEAPEPEQLGDLYASIGTLLRSQYIVRFDTSGVTATGELPVEIQITADAGTVTATGSYRPSDLDAPPVITVRGLRPDETVDAPREIAIDVQSRQPVTRVLVTVDGTTAAEFAGPPFVFRFEPDAYGGGGHSVDVLVEAGGNSTSQTVAFTTPLVADGGGSMPSLFTLIGGAIAALGILGAGRIFVRARRALPEDEDFAGPAAEGVAALRDVGRWAKSIAPRGMAALEPSPEVEPESIGEPMGILICRAGPALGSEYSVGGSPVSIGSAQRCAVRIDDLSLGGVEARVWVRAGQLMLHRMTRLTDIAVATPTGGWMILAPGDTFDIGANSFEFRLLPQEHPDRVPASEPSPPPPPLRPAAESAGPQLRWGTPQPAPSASAGPSGADAPNPAPTPLFPRGMDDDEAQEQRAS